MKTFSPLLLFCFMILAACTPAPQPPSTSTPIAASPTLLPADTAVPTATPIPTATLAPTNFPTPTDTPTPALIPLQPLITAPFLYFAGWSPDSRMLAYWTYSQEEVNSIPVEGATGYPPGVLHFYDTVSETTCDYPTPAPYSFLQPTFAWQADGRVAIRGDDRIIRLSTPCQDDFSTVTGSEAEMLLDNPEYSPSGLYQAHADIEADEVNAILTYHLTITDLATQKVVNTLDWQVPSALGTNPSPGGQWIDDGLFLVNSSLAGPILVPVGETPQNVLMDLFHLSGTCLEPGCENSVYAAARRDTFTGNLHVLLLATGLQDTSSDVLLFHGEDGSVEPLSAKYLRSPNFSSDGRWLLLDPTGSSDELWLRPVDPSGSRAVRFSDTPTSSWPPAFSPDSSNLAYSTQNGLVEALSLTDQSVLGTWSLAPFEPRQITWSPNGSSLVVESASYTQGEQVYALYVITSARQGTLADAQTTLTDYFRLLHEGQYAQAIPFYGGTYNLLQTWNPDIVPTDFVNLWQHACEFNGLRCLPAGDLLSQMQTTPTEFHFLVEFQNDDGSLFVLGPCCGATEEEMPPVSQFEYTVVLGLNGQYRVLELPVYVP